MGSPPKALRPAPALASGLLLALLALGVAAGGCGSAGAPAPREPARLANLRLGPDYSHWLVGPIAFLATPEEVERYLALENDFAAIDAIEAFWARRDPDPSDRSNPPRATFDRRAAEADRRFGEGGLLGRRTPRGILYVIHGEPASTEFEIALDGGPPIEVWRYPEAAAPGLDGQPPERVYRFRRRGEITAPYQPGGRRTTLPPPS